MHTYQSTEVTEMRKKEIIKIRNAVYNALCVARLEKTTYSPLLRKNWQNYGYVHTSAYFG